VRGGWPARLESPDFVLQVWAEHKRNASLIIFTAEGLDFPPLSVTKQPSWSIRFATLILIGKGVVIRVILRDTGIKQRRTVLISIPVITC
jgi:predicted Kef-type K+ transport protein